MKKSHFKHFLICLSAGILFSCGNTQENKDNNTTDTTAKAEEAKEKPKADNRNQRDLEYVSYADSINKGLIEKDTLKTSARLEVEGKIGEASIKINHGSPGVRGRTVWNGLVAYDQVWVTGSHSATSVTFSQDIEIQGTKVPAGTYAFFTIPSAQEWTLIINKNYQQHLADDYTEKEDVVRLKVKPETLENTVQRLTYAINKKTDEEGAITMSWEKIKVSLPFKVVK